MPSKVALRKESVDRNGTSLTLIIGFLESLSARRAWIEIEVENGFAGVLLSLSARRAWIEILLWQFGRAFWPVALRKESVDRNSLWCILCLYEGGSLSARRAWIEIANFCRNRFCPTSLSARRAWIEIWPVAILLISVKSRSPQGERG